MRLKELLRLVWINVSQNKFKVILTSIGIVVGAATIMMVIAIGRGGQLEVAEQFKNLNAGAIDISFEQNGGSSGGEGSEEGGFSGGSMGGGMPGGSMGGGMPSGSTGGGMPSGSMGGGMPNVSVEVSIPAGQNSGSAGMLDFGSMGGGFGGFAIGGGSGFDSRINQEKVTLSSSDVEDIEVFVPGITEATISFSSKSAVDGGDLEEETTYTVAGVKSNYAAMSNLTLAMGDFITDDNDESKAKVCILGASVAKEIFGSAYDAYDSTIYIDDRPYVVNGILEEMGSVSSGISPDEAIFIPYETGIKYIVGNQASPTITVIAEDVMQVDTVKENVETVLAESYPNTEFTLTDAGSKMEAASASNDTLTMLLIAMAVIVFIVGGIGIMNVLFVSVKERTNEIGILKAIGCKQKDILLEFLFEASAISFIGGILGVVLSLGITPIIESFQVRVELSLEGAVISLLFGIITGTVFGFYPAFKASRLIPVVALNQE